MRRASPILPPAAVAVVLALPFAAPFALAQNVSTFASGQSAVCGLAFDGSGILYVSRRTPSNVLVKCVPPSNTMTLVASGFADPVALVCDAAGNIYVADYDYGGAGGGVRKVTPGGTKSTFASVPNPVSLAIDAAGNVYVGRYDRIINKVTPGGVVSTYADLNSVSYLGVASANNHVVGLAMDTDGTLYASTTWGGVFKIGPGGSPITGIFRIPYEGFGVAIARDGHLYGTSYTYCAIWRIATDGTAALYAGQTSVAGLVNGPLLSARFNVPAGIACGPAQLYVADYGNAAIRAVDFVVPAKSNSWGRLKALYR